MTKESWELGLQYLGVILSWEIFSWPSVFLVVFFFWFWKRDVVNASICDLLREIKEFKAGAFSFSTNQPPDLASVNEIENKEEEKKEKEISELKNDLDDKRSEAEKLAVYWYQRSRDYEFRYLNLFLVVNSKRSLKWFSKFGDKGTTKELYLITAEFRDITPEQKEIIFSVLLAFDLVSQKQSGCFGITEKGDDFIRRFFSAGKEL